MALSYLVLAKSFIMHVVIYTIDQISKISLGHRNASSSPFFFRFGLSVIDAGCYKMPTSH